MRDRDALIIGGGISGLSAAFYLSRRGVKTTLVEPSVRLGGLIQTNLISGCRLEAGPDSFIATKPAVQQLAMDLGIQHDLIGSNDAERRVFIVRHGALTPMPKGMAMMVPTDIAAALASPLFGEDSKQCFRSEENTLPLQRPGDFSIRELVEPHFGTEALEYVTEPLLSGVYGGNAAELSARSVLPRFVEYERVYGSLIEGARREARTAQPGSLFLSFANGMEQLIQTLAEQIDTFTNIVHDRCLAIEPDSAGGYRVRCEHREFYATQVIAATPAHVTARLLEPLDEALAGELASIPYSSAILSTFLFEQQSFHHPLNGFGFLVPRPERNLVAAATWINTKFPTRVAPGSIAVRAFLVDPEAEQQAHVPDGDLSRATLADLHRMMRISATPIYADIHRWPRSMPQYVVGHSERIDRVLNRLTNHPRLHLASNYLDGIGIPDCVRWGSQSAAQVVAQLVS